MKIGVTGSSYFGKILARELRNHGIDAEFVETSLIRCNLIKKVLKKDIIHFIFSPTTSSYGLITVIQLKLLFRKKIIVTWVGSDTLLATKIRGYIYSKIGNKFIDLNIAETKWIAEELRRLSLENCVVCPLPYCKDARLVPMCLPQKFTVLVYLPQERFDFYGGKICESIIDSFKNVRFIIVANNGYGIKKRANVEFLGWVNDMNKVYSQTTVFLRIPKHDGLSCMVLEALSAGRYVIYSYPLNGCFYARTYDDVRHYLNKLLNTPELKLNIEGRNFFIRNYDKNVLVKKLISIYQKVTARKS